MDTVERLKTQLLRMNEINRDQMQTIRNYEQMLQDIGDQLLAVGNTPDEFRKHYPGYLSPQEREVTDNVRLDDPVMSQAAQ